jgi:O-antigen/teichoic acid export membrane protein
MGKYRRLGKNILLVFIGNAGSKLIGLLMLPFYTRWLSVEDYGTTDIINVYVSLLFGLVTGCIMDSIFIFPKDQSIEKQKSYFSSGLIFAFSSLLLTAILFWIVNRILVYLELSNSFTRNVWFIYSLLVTNFFQQYMQQFARSIDKMKVYSTTGIIITGITAVCSAFAIPIWGVLGYVLSLIFANLMGAAYSFLCSSAYRYFSIKAVKKNTCMVMLKYSVPLIPSSMMWWFVGAFNRPLMEGRLGMHAVGIFAVANKFPSIISFLFSTFTLSWQISVVEEFSKEGYPRFFNTIFRIGITGLFLIFFAITIFNRLIIGIFATVDFYEAALYIPVLALGAVFSSISGIIGSNFLAVRESKYLFYSSMWGAAFSIMGNILFIPMLGIMGAAITVPLSFAAIMVSRIIYGWKYVQIQEIPLYLFMLFIALIAIIVMIYIQNSWLKYCLFMILFCLFIFINYGLKKKMPELFQILRNMSSR